MPREVHEHWAVDPAEPENRDKHVLTGITVVTRESAWDDNSRARAIALTEYEESLCGCGCGLPREVAHKKQGFNVDSFVCWAGRAVEQVKKADRAAHEGDEAWFAGRHYFAVPARQAVDDN